MPSACRHLSLNSESTAQKSDLMRELVSKTRKDVHVIMDSLRYNTFVFQEQCEQQVSQTPVLCKDDSICQAQHDPKMRTKRE
jgi:hypothetical protein